jgi:hypothetical protein
LKTIGVGVTRNIRLTDFPNQAAGPSYD